MSATTEATADSLAVSGTPSYEFSFEPCPHRVRAEFEGVSIADSDAVMVLEETRLPPVHYFPREHVRMDLMRPTGRRTHCPFKGNASYWTLEVNGRVAENVMWSGTDSRSTRFIRRARNTTRTVATTPSELRSVV